MVETTTTPDESLGAFVRELVIAEVIEETSDARSVVFEVPDSDGDRFHYSPGQFLTLRIPSELQPTARCYSLSSSPHVDDLMTVTIKRTPEGFGSNWLCDNARPGMRMHVLPPSGHFVPRSLDVDMLLCAAGSGITPMLAIIKSALTRGSGTLVLFYANRNDQSVIFRDQLQSLCAKFPGRLTVVHWLESVQGLPTGDALTSVLGPFTPGREAYLCGPAPFMDVVTNALQESGLEHRHIHVEKFHSIAGDVFAAVAPLADDGEDAATVTVELDGESHTLAWPRTQTLLDTMLAAGVDAPFSCKEGSCSSCACFLREGSADMICNDILEDEELAEGQVLACQLLPRSDNLKVDYG